MPRLTTLLALSFERRAPGDDLSFVQFHRRDRSGARPNFAAECRIVLNRERLPVMFWLGHDDAVDEDARYLDLPRVERTAFSDPFHLHDDDAAGVARRHRDRQHFEGERLLFHRDVAVGIGGRAPNDADIDREGAIEEKFLAVDLDQIGRGRLWCIRLSCRRRDADRRMFRDPRE